jgi:transcriptional regulator of acetoin/glycerol metabolism
VLEIAKTSDSATPFITEVNGRRDVRLSCALVTWLVQRDYPGNTRELEEVLRVAMFASTDDTIELAIDAETPHAAADEDEDDDSIAEVALRQALAKSGGNQTRASGMLGKSRHRVRRLMIKFGIEPSR